MNNLVKLIWDFYGEDSFKTASHHQIHLIDYLKNINYSINISEVIKLSEFDCFVYIVVKDDDMIKFRDILKPIRAELYEN